MLIKARHLMTLLNRLGDEVIVQSPLLGFQLFTLDLSARTARVRDVISSGDYNTIRMAALGQVESAIASRFAASDPAVREDLCRAVKSEIPDYGRLRDAFRQAGVVAPSNLDKICALLEQARRSNPAHGGDIYYFAFDNNALRNRLYSQFLRPQSPRDARYNFVLARQVLNEIDCRLGKSLGAFMEAMEAAMANLNAASVFANQNRLADRLRQLAKAEWNDLLACGSCEIVETGREQPNAPVDSDNIIIAAYEQFAGKPGRKVVLFSSDNEFVTQASGRTNVIDLMVDYSHNPWPVVSAARWEDVSRLLYHLAVVYGRLDLQMPGVGLVRMYGVWKDKIAEDWEQEHSRVTMDIASSPVLKALHDEMARDLAILAAATQA